MPEQRIGELFTEINRAEPVPLIDLPESYLLWFADRGFPRGELGRLMALAMILSVENLKHLVTPFRD